MTDFKQFANAYELQELKRLKKRFDKAILKMEFYEYEYEHHKQLSAYKNLKQSVRIIDRERNSIVIRLLIRQKLSF